MDCPGACSGALPDGAVIDMASQARSLSQPLGLVWTLARTDFKSRYQPTVGGFLWALMKPVAMFLVLNAVFSFIFASNPEYRLNLVIGLCLWDFFAESTKTGLTSLQVKGYLLNKAHFPKWILVVSSISNAVITLLVFCVVIISYLIVTGRQPRVVVLGLFALYVLLFVVMIVGFSLGSSVLFAHYRDLNQVWELVSQAGFFMAPIIYPLSIIPERFHLLLYLWPPTPVIQFSREVLVEQTIPSATAHGLLITEALLTLSVGIFVFRRFSPGIAEHL